MEYLVKTYTNPGDTVLDTFGGYATTALACQRLGDRNCISVELSQEWHDKGIERLKSHEVQEPDRSSV